MIISHNYEGKNKEDLLNNCIKEINVEKKDIYYNFKESESGLFKTKKYYLSVVKREEVTNYIKIFFDNLSSKMCININCEIRFNDNIINVLLITDNNNIIIGKDGKTLNAIQLLLRQATFDLNQYNLKILLDASNYREKKTRHLEYEIKNICNEVITSKIEVKLDPMNSYDRRIVHSIVGNYPELSSNSVGEEPNRCTIIKYKD